MCQLSAANSIITLDTVQYMCQLSAANSIITLDTVQYMCQLSAANSIITLDTVQYDAILRSGKTISNEEHCIGQLSMRGLSDLIANSTDNAGLNPFYITVHLK